MKIIESIEAAVAALPKLEPEHLAVSPSTFAALRNLPQRTTPLPPLLGVPVYVDESLPEGTWELRPGASPGAEGKGGEG